MKCLLDKHLLGSAREIEEGVFGSDENTVLETEDSVLDLVE